MLRLTGRMLRATAIAAAVACAYGVGVISGAGTDGTTDAERRSVLDEAAGRISQDAAAPVDGSELQRAAIEGMLRRLGDRWAGYYTAQEFDDEQGRLNGHYSGVGLWLGGRPGEGTSGQRASGNGAPGGGSGGESGDGLATSPSTSPSTSASRSGASSGSRSASAAAPAAPAPVRVASVQPGSAAARGGMRVGDEIITIDGRPVTGWNTAKIARALRGRPATGVEVGVRRGHDQHRFRLVRTALRTSDVDVQQHARNVQLIRIGAFTRGVGRQVRDVVVRDLDRHSKGILLDLRGNPGGLLDEAVETASAFLAGGPVVTYERRGVPPRRRDVTSPGDGRTPLVVLVDAGTASSAEVVAGSLRDRDRAVIVGSRTFGKGSVQEPVELADGSAMELTVGRYRTPSGRNLDGIGIDPDVEVSADRPPRAAEQRAEAVLRGLLATLPKKDRG